MPAVGRPWPSDDNDDDGDDIRGDGDDSNIDKSTHNVGPAG